MDTNSENQDILRVAIVTVLSAISFGVNQIFLSSTIPNQDLGTSALSVFSKIFINSVLILFLLYLLVLGLSRTYGSRWSGYAKEIHPFLYKLGILITTTLLFMTVMLLIGVELLKTFNNEYIFYVIVIVALLISFCFTLEGLKHGTRKKGHIQISKSDKHLILAVIAIFLTIAVFAFGTNNNLRLAEQSLNHTFWVTTPVSLLVNDTFDESENRWTINVTNGHPFRDTGSIYLYRLEKNSHRPHLINLAGLSSGESVIFSPVVKSDVVYIDFNRTELPYGFGARIPVGEAYYANEYFSISFKLTCDNCPAHGIIRRLPDFGVIQPILTYSSNVGVTNVSLPYYEWMDYDPEIILSE